MASDTSWIWTPETNPARRLMRQTTVMAITPTVARLMLESQQYNRKVRNGHVVELASAITRGEWRTTHQGIAFDNCGRLIDGQHRLRAIILSGVSIDMMVTIGCDPSDFEVMDISATRTAADRLRTDRYIAEVARLACHMLLNSRRPSVEQMRKVLDTGLKETSEKLHEECATASNIVSSAPVRMAACLRMMDEPAHEKWIMATYRSMILRNYEDIDQTPLVLLKLIDRRTIHASQRYQLLTRAAIAFDYERKDTGSIRVSGERIEETLVWARSVLRIS